MTNQPTNPLVERKPAKAGKVTVEMLHDLATSLNATRWVRDSGFPYFVNVRIDEAKGPVHYLDRKVERQFNAAA